MNFREIAVSVPQKDCDTAAAIANMVVPYGIYVEDYSDLEQGAEEIAHIDLIDEQLLSKNRDICIIHIYITEEENTAEALAFLTERFAAAGIDFTVNEGNVNDADWRDNWKKFFKVTDIGERLVIKPSWEDYKNRDNKAVLNIDPGAAFGTGTHATTKMCLELLDKYTQSGNRVLDIGCGSGILSIAAVLLGAEKAVGVDIDATAVRVSKENAALNDISDKTEYIKGNLTDSISGKYDIICANIVADAILSLLGTVKEFMHDDTMFICSGIIDIRAEEVRAALSENGFAIIDAPKEDNWHAFAARLSEA